MTPRKLINAKANEELKALGEKIKNKNYEFEDYVFQCGLCLYENKDERFFITIHKTEKYVYVMYGKTYDEILNSFMAYVSALEFKEMGF